MTRRRSKHLIWLHCPSQRNSLLLCGQDWHRQLPPSVLVFLAVLVFCLFDCVISLPTGPIPDLFQKYLAISSSPFWLPLCPVAARGVLHCCWVTFADTLLSGTGSHSDFLRWNSLLICVSVFVFVDVLSLIFLCLSCDIWAVPNYITITLI